LGIRAKKVLKLVLPPQLPFLKSPALKIDRLLGINGNSVASGDPR